MSTDFFAYVPNCGSDTVSVIDTTTNSFDKDIPVADQPHAVAITPDGTTVYVLCNDKISVIETTTNSFVKDIPLDSRPFGIAITPDGTTAYVILRLSDEVIAINTSTNSIIKHITIDDPRDIVITPDSTTAYVTKYDSISVINTTNNSLMQTFQVGHQPILTLSPDGTTIYVVCDEGNGKIVKVIDTSKYNTIDIVDLNLPSSYDWAEMISTTPNGSHVYTNIYETMDVYDAIAIIQTSNNSLVYSFLDIPFHHLYVTSTPDSKKIYYSDYISEKVVPFDTINNTSEPDIALGDGPYYIAITPDSTTGYVVNNYSVSVIDVTNNSFVKNIVPPNTPPLGQYSFISITPDGKSAYLFAGSQYSDKIWVIDTISNSFSTVISVGDYPHDIVFTPLAKNKIDTLISKLENLKATNVLKPGQYNSLQTKLNKILEDLAQGKIQPVKGQLTAFINEVERLMRNPKLSEEEKQKYQSLIDLAQNILNSL